MAGIAKETDRIIVPGRRSLKVADLITKDDFSSYLECPVCLDVPIPPVFLCVTGHLICGACRKKVKSCGLCSGAFVGGRNFFYENMFEKTSFLCRYTFHGCDATVLGKELKNHHTVCDFRPLPCIKYGCPRMKEGHFIDYSNFVEHFTKAHNVKVNYRHLGKVCNGWPADADNWVISRWVHEVYKFQDNYFFITCQIRKPEIGIWVWILGSETEAKRFRVSFKLGDAVNPSSKLKSPEARKQISLMWEGPVHSIRSTSDDVMNSGECLVTSLNTVKALCIRQQTPDARNYWELQFEITETAAAPNPNIHRHILHSNVTVRRKCNSILEEFSVDSRPNSR